MIVSLERQAGAFVIGRMAMAGIAGKKRNRAVSDVGKTKGKPKLPVNNTPPKQGDNRCRRFRRVEINTPRRPQAKSCWCRWTRSPGAIRSCFDIGASLNDSTSRRTPQSKGYTHDSVRNAIIRRTRIFSFCVPAPFFAIFGKTGTLSTEQSPVIRVRKIREGETI